MCVRGELDIGGPRPEALSAIWLKTLSRLPRLLGRCLPRLTIAHKKNISEFVAIQAAEKAFAAAKRETIHVGSD